MRFEVDRTRDLFHRGFPLIERLPPPLRPDVELFIHGGLGILSKIERGGYNVWACRPVLTRWEKGGLLLGALYRRVRTALVGG
jgi:hypothetical protein